MVFLRLLIAIILTAVVAFPQSAQEKAELEQIARERTPNLGRLNELLRMADRVVVVSVEGEKETKLFESSKAQDLAELRDALRLTAPDEWRMAVCAEPYIYFYRGDEKLMSIGYASGHEVKTSVWSGNATLGEPEKWFAWFDQHGMPQVRAENERRERDAKEYEEAERRWDAAMPRGIREPYEKQLANFGLPSAHDANPFKPILEKEYPKKSERILAVLHWFGSGKGSWNGYPSYESIAEDILFSFTTAEILAALESRTLSATETEGAARLFSGWDYYKQRPDDLKLLPQDKKTAFRTFNEKS